MALWWIAVFPLAACLPGTTGEDDLVAFSLVLEKNGYALQAESTSVEEAKVDHSEKQFWYKYGKMIVSLADGRCLTWYTEQLDRRVGKVIMADCVGGSQQEWNFSPYRNVSSRHASSVLRIQNARRGQNDVFEKTRFRENRENQSVCLWTEFTTRQIHWCHENKFVVKEVKLKTPARLRELFRTLPVEHEAVSSSQCKEDVQKGQVEKQLEDLKREKVKLEEDLKTELAKAMKELDANMEKHRELVKEMEKRKELPAANPSQVATDAVSASHGVLILGLLGLLGMVFKGGKAKQELAERLREVQEELQGQEKSQEELKKEVEQLRKSVQDMQKSHDRRLSEGTAHADGGRERGEQVQLMRDLREYRKEMEQSMGLLRQLQEQARGREVTLLPLSARCMGSWTQVTARC